MASLHDIVRGDIIPLSGLAVSIGRNSFDPPSPTVPFYDIHYRSAVLYDSGAPAQSGILTFNSLNNRLQLIPSNSGVQNVVTAVYFYAYDGTGGTSINTSDTTVVFDTVTVNTHPDLYVLSANVLQLNASGTYDFNWRVSTQNSTGIALQLALSTWLEQQAPGGSFVEVSGTRSYVFNRASTIDGHQGTSSANYIVPDVGVGHKFRIRAESTSTGTTCVTLANGSAIKVQKVS